MKTMKIAALPLVAALVMGCGGKEPKPQTEDRVIETVDSTTGIITLRDYEISDTITVDGKLYSYTYALQHADSLGVVINPQGLEYKESYVSIKVEHDGEKVYANTFTKNDFGDYVPTKDLETYTMVGVNYNITKRDEDRSALYFIVTVGDPDEASDMALPLELKIMPDGSSTMSKAKNLETEPLNPNLSKDPGTEEGV